MRTGFIVARFIGEDKSLGYRTNRVYPLLITAYTFLERFFGKGWGIEIKRLDNTGFCPYRNEDTFNQNWRVAGGKHRIKVTQYKK